MPHRDRRMTTPPPPRSQRCSAPSPAAPLRCAQLSLFDAPNAPPVEAPSAPVSPSALQAEVSPPFAHPLADSRIELKGCTVAYALRRAQRRSIGLLVGADGLRVSAPRWATRRDIETALNDKADWIVRKLSEQVERARQMQAAQLDWGAGALPYLGQPMQVRLASRTEWQPDAQPAVLSIGLASTASPAEVQSTVMAWLKRQAIALFVQRCEHFAPRLQVKHSKVLLSNAQTRWGSAHASGVIRLNWRLIHFAPHVIDYVVVHELAHLHEMNHGPRFWSLVGSVVPNVNAAQQVLKETVLPVWR